MAKTFTSFGRFTANAINTNTAALQKLQVNIASVSALSPKQLLALSVMMRAQELTTLGTVTAYNPTTTAGIRALQQDAQTVFGSVPEFDMLRAMLCIDINNNVNAGGITSPQDIDTLIGTSYCQYLAALPDQDLKRMIAYLRLEIEE